MAPSSSVPRFVSAVVGAGATVDPIRAWRRKHPARMQHPGQRGRRTHAAGGRQGGIAGTHGRRTCDSGLPSAAARSHLSRDAEASNAATHRSREGKKFAQFGAFGLVRREIGCLSGKIF